MFQSGVVTSLSDGICRIRGLADAMAGELLAFDGTLRGMVEQCNTELNLDLFPEEVSAIAAVLHRDHYRAGWRQAARPASR